MSFSFFRFLKEHCHGNHLKSKIWHFFAIPKWITISQFQFQKVQRMNFSALYTILVTFGPVTQEFTLLTITPFAAKLQNRHITPNISEYPGPILTYFTRSFWRSPNGRCYGYQLNLEDGCRHRQELPLFLASAFDNGLADRKSAYKMFNGNNPATLCTNLVNFRPIILEFTLLKCAIFATICPQFDDDLHLSCRRSKTDWNITISISSE